MLAHFERDRMRSVREKITMQKRKIVTIGEKAYLVIATESDGKWSALVVPKPPPDGQPYIFPPWTCDAESEDELDAKLDRHFEKLVAKQKTDD